MKTLVTGGAGFIGSHLVRSLIERGDGVRVLDDLSTGSADAVPEGADLVRGSLLDGRAPRRAVEGVNVASGGQVSVLELLRACEEATGAKAEPLFEPPRQGEQRRAYASVQKARELLGYEPQYNLRQGLAETVEWMRRAILR